MTAVTLGGRTYTHRQFYALLGTLCRRHNVVTASRVIDGFRFDIARNCRSCHGVGRTMFEALADAVGRMEDMT